MPLTDLNALRSPSTDLPSPVTAGDLVVAIFWLVVATASWAVSWSEDDAGPLRFRVSVDGVIIHEAALGDGQSTHLSVTGSAGVSTLEVRAGRVRVSDSPCRQHVCVQAGWLSQPGDLAVCVPNALVVRVSGQRQDGVDAVTR